MEEGGFDVDGDVGVDVEKGLKDGRNLSGQFGPVSDFKFAVLCYKAVKSSSTPSNG